MNEICHCHWLYFSTIILSLGQCECAIIQKVSLALFLQITIKTSLTNIYTITALIQSTRYNIQVTTLTTEGDSPKSKVLPVTTKKLDMTAADEWRDTLGINTIVKQLNGAVNDITSLKYLKSDFRNLKSDVKSLNSTVRNHKKELAQLDWQVTDNERYTLKSLVSINIVQFENNIP